MQITIKPDKRFFFDRKLVEQYVGQQYAKMLGQAGAFVQRRARGSLRRAGKKARAAKEREPAPPGRPPRVWSTDNYATLKNIQFQFNPQRLSVVVGPVKLNMGGMGATPIPGLHENGGVMRILEWRFNQVELMKRWRGWGKYTSSAKFSNEWRRRDLRWRNQSRKRRKHTLQDIGVETRTRVARYPARPFMGPALVAEAPKFPSLFTSARAAG